MQNELIHAKKNHGLYLNNQKHLSKPSVTAKFLVYSHGSFDKERYEISNKLKKIIPYPRYFGSCVFNGINIVLDRVDCAIFTKLAIWDIAAIILFAKEANLYYQFISKPPDVNHPNIKSYQHSLVIGPKNLTKSIIKIVKPIIS